MLFSAACSGTCVASSPLRSLRVLAPSDLQMKRCWCSIDSLNRLEGFSLTEWQNRISSRPVCVFHFIAQLVEAPWNSCSSPGLQLKGGLLTHYANLPLTLAVENTAYGASSFYSERLTPSYMEVCLEHMDLCNVEQEVAVTKQETSFESSHGPFSFQCPSSPPCGIHVGLKTTTSTFRHTADRAREDVWVCQWERECLWEPVSEGARERKCVCVDWIHLPSRHCRSSEALEGSNEGGKKMSRRKGQRENN